MKKNEKNEGIKKYSKQMIAIAIALVLVIGGSYAWLTLTLNGTKTNTITAGTLAVELDEAASEGINMTSAVPMSDTDGLATTAYTFSLKNTGNITSDYSIYLTDVELSNGETRMADSVVKYSITKNAGSPTTALLSTLSSDTNGRALDSGSIAASGTNTYTLKLWIDQDAINDVMGKVFSAKISVSATQQNITE